VDEHGTNLHTTYHYHTQVFDATCAASDVCAEGDTYVASSTGPYQCYKADLSASEGSSALLTMSSQYADKNTMGTHCCGMTDYYVLTGITLDDEAVDSASTCAVPSVSHGIYDTDPCVAGATMFSGWQCSPTCEDGYALSGTTRCVGGTLVETASCDGASPPPSPSPSPPPSPPPDDGTCMSWCPNNSNPWSKKCNWIKCGGCSDCDAYQSYEYEHEGVGSTALQPGKSGMHL